MRMQDFPFMEVPSLWQHFVLHGQHEGRPFRYTCVPKVMTGAEAFAAGQVLQAAAADFQSAAESTAATVTPSTGLPARQLLAKAKKLSSTGQKQGCLR